MINTNDGLQSIVSGLGMSGRDKAATVTYVDAIDESQLAAAYETSWAAKKIVNIPAEDALRKWRKWQADPKQISAIEGLEKQLGLQQKLLQCYQDARLYGGSALFIGTDQDSAQPLLPESIKQGGIKYLSLLSKEQLQASEKNEDPLTPGFGLPLDYDLDGVKIHPSRLVIMRGEGVNDDGWGKSSLKAPFEAVKNADSVIANIASLVFEANVDVFGVPDFMQSMSDPEYEKRILKRFSLAATAKGINRTLVHDADEKFDRKSISFAQLPELIEKFLLIVSGAADIPLTRFLGQSPSGLASSGEGDMKNYYDHINSIQTLKIEPALMILDQCLINSAVGKNDGIWYEWSPLEQMNEKQVAEIGKIVAETVSILSMTGVLGTQELSEAAINQLIETKALAGLEQIVAR